MVRPKLHPATVLFGYLGLLLMAVAALVVWPFSEPLLWLFLSPVAVFFGFAGFVISLSFCAIVQAVWALTGAAGRGPLTTKPGPSISPRGSELRDHWLDGV